MNNALTTDQSRQGVMSNQQKQNIPKPSLRSAINAKCHECIYLSINRHWELEIAGKELHFNFMPALQRKT